MSYYFFSVSRVFANSNQVSPVSIVFFFGSEFRINFSFCVVNFLKKIKPLFTDRVWKLKVWRTLEGGRLLVTLKVAGIHKSWVGMELHSCFQLSVVILHVHVQMGQVIYLLFPVRFLSWIIEAAIFHFILNSF